MSSIKYFIRGTLKGSRHHDGHIEDITPYELPEYLEYIKGLFDHDDDDELAQYMHDDKGLIGVVTEIWVDVKVINGDLYSWTEVTANRELTNTEKEALLEYLTGQFSDGYGEGLEQIEFKSGLEREEFEEFDEETQEYYMDAYDVRVDYYLHLWQSKGHKLEFVEEEPKEEVKTPSKPRCKLIGEDGNIFNLLGLASRSLKKANMGHKISEMMNRVTSSDSYEKALAIIMEYVEVE